MFFIIANFTFSGVIAVVGILTLTKVSKPNEVLFASLPLLFALHQFTQGIVWLGLYDLTSPGTLHVAETIFVFYAQAALPFLVPLAIWLQEPKSTQRNLMAMLVIFGGLLMLYVTWGLTVEPTSVSIEHHALVYSNPSTSHLRIALAYIVTTCGPLLLSRSAAIQLFGWLNVLGLVAVYMIAQYAFTSLWCLYAAIVSCVLYLHFIERRIAFLQALKREESFLGAELEEELQKLIGRYPRIRKVFHRHVEPKA
ncbi:MAG: hypothetical protein PVH21_00185 [Myxococcales bacterium]